MFEKIYLYVHRSGIFLVTILFVASRCLSGLRLPRSTPKTLITEYRSLHLRFKDESKVPKPDQPSTIPVWRRPSEAGLNKHVYL